jgi:hypothetical protein
LANASLQFCHFPPDWNDFLVLPRKWPISHEYLQHCLRREQPVSRSYEPNQSKTLSSPVTVFFHEAPIFTSHFVISHVNSSRTRLHKITAYSKCKDEPSFYAFISLYSFCTLNRSKFLWISPERCVFLLNIWS